MAKQRGKGVIGDAAVVEAGDLRNDAHGGHADGGGERGLKDDGLATAHAHIGVEHGADLNAHECGCAEDVIQEFG